MFLEGAGYLTMNKKKHGEGYIVYFSPVIADTSTIDMTEIMIYKSPE